MNLIPLLILNCQDTINVRIKTLAKSKLKIFQNFLKLLLHYFKIKLDHCYEIIVLNSTKQTYTKRTSHSSGNFCLQIQSFLLARCKWSVSGESA